MRHLDVIARSLTGLAFALGAVSAQSSGAATDEASPRSASAEHPEPLFEAHCADCHDAGRKKGGLDLLAARAPLERLQLLSTVRDRVRAGEMPPRDAEALEAADRARLLAACDATLRAQVPLLPKSPGRVTVRRLSRAQWEHTVCDLFGVRTELAAAFPQDDLAYGFDNIGDALSFSTLHLEKYLAAAADVAAQVFPENASEPPRRRTEGERMRLEAGSGANLEGDVAGLYTVATVGADVVLPRDGVYRLRILVGADQGGSDPARMSVRLDGRELDVVDVGHDDLRAVDFTMPMLGGRRHVGLAFLNDYYQPENPDPKRRDRNLRVDWFEVQGPLDALPVPGQQQWFAAERTAALNAPGAPPGALAVLAERLAARVFRGAADAAAAARLVAVGERALQAGLPPHVAAQHVLTAALLSPRFLFRGEPSAAAADGADVAVPGQALAVRLSYFLWSSAPDERLLELGDRLGSADVLDAEVARMLGDARAERLATDFAAQWLELRALEVRTPDPDRFPGFDDELRHALRRESELLFWRVLQDGLDVRTLLDCDFTHVDRRLAAFYGIDGAFGDAFERVQLPPALRVRGGVLGHGSIHAVTSNPTRTSPVKRGKWILENLLGQAPPPPPPGNDSLADEAQARTPQGLRAQLAAHRDRAACASCHVRMDALGLPLEHFDAIGRERGSDEHGAIDCSSELPDGRHLDGLADLKAALMADPALPRTLLRKLFVYAVGREPAAAERLRLDLAVDERAAAGTVTIADLIRLVVHSDAFLRRGTGT